MFGAQLYKPGVEDHEKSSLRLRPGLDTAAWVEFDENIVDGKSYDIEFARLKVKNGDNAGKYYVYFKMDDKLISESYVNEGVVDSKGKYVSNPGSTECRISNEIYMTAWGNSGNKISALPGEATYYDYDEVYYGDLLYNGKPLAMETTMNGGKVFTYNKTSPTGSVILRYRWTAVEGAKFQISFDTGKDGKVNYMFGAQLYTPGSEEGHPNSSIRLRPGYDDANAWVDFAENIVDGANYDIEFARLKIKGGDNAGKYYVYFKVNGELIAESYVGSNVVDGEGNYVSSPSATPGKISNEIYLTFWNASGNKISATPFPETYEDYDEIYYSDLMKSGKALAVGGTRLNGGNVLTYNRTSPTGSAILKYRWTVGTVAKFQLSFEKTSASAMAYMFGAWLSEPGAESGFPNGRMWLRPGYGPQVAIENVIEPNSDHDIELARLKVANGPNKGKYYVYVKIDGELIAEDYVSAGIVDDNLNYYSKPNDVACSMATGEIFLAFWGSEGNEISATPYTEEYEDYDVIGYTDLYKDGNPVPADGRTMSGATVFTYNRTSPTGSAIFKYRWTIGTVAKFQMSFEKTASNTMAYMFGAWLSEPGAEANYPDGRMWLRPGYGPQVGITEVLTAGSSHNVEFARLKVKSGPNKGKYYVYIKIDDEMLAEDYVAEGIVDDNLNYYSNPNDTQCSIASNEIFFAFWGSEGNRLSSYKEPGVNVHAGTRGDFDGNGIVDSADFANLISTLFGRAITSEAPDGVADFNNDAVADISDLIAVKKHIAPVNTYAKSNELAIGTQEHLLDDETKTAAYIADATATLGANVYRISMPIHQLYFATETNGVSVKTDNMNAFKEMIAELKNRGINEILYVTDSFILPYGYNNPANTHNKTVPDPVKDSANYLAWLNVNSAAMGALAAEVPEIKFFEPFNEINVLGSRLETYGIGWNATSEEQAAHRFTVAEKAGIMADLCWYVSKAVKAVDAANQVTTPSISLSNSSAVESGFIDAFYKAIESGNYPTGQTLADKRIDNYFTIVNIHLYPDYADSNLQTKVNNFATSINEGYAVIKAHNDGGSRVWLTETGVSTKHNNGTSRNEETAGTLLGMTLNKINSDLTYVDTVITYKLADISSDKGASPIETNYGLFYSGDDLDNDPYAAKPTAKAVYSFTHGGSTDYSVLDALAARYDG